MRRTLLWCLTASLLAVLPARADEPSTRAGATAQAGGEQPQRPRGKPKIKLDRLDFPKDVPNVWYLERQLRKVLRREARRVDWGAGRGSTITYRFSVKRLAITEEDGVLRVSCTAIGRLPKGKQAKGSLTFGGDPRRRNAVIGKVLQIVARGVLTRLAELERIRRGDLRRSRVRRPILVQ
jgi:hypothetical protein